MANIQQGLPQQHTSHINFIFEELIQYESRLGHGQFHGTCERSCVQSHHPALTVVRFSCITLVFISNHKFIKKAQSNDIGRAPN